MKAGNPEKYEGLEISDAAKRLLKSDPEKFASYCNGVGSRIGFWNNLAYHFIPNTIWFMDITPASDIHDVEYTVPDSFPFLGLAAQAFEAANLRIYKNIQTLIKRKSNGGILYRMRMRRAELYYYALCSDAAWNSFISGKTIAGVMHK